MIEFAEGSRVYVDSNIFIYFVEKSPEYFDRTAMLFAAVEACGGTIVTCDLAIFECLYRPFKDDNARLVGLYQSLFEDGDEIERVPLNDALLMQAAMNGGKLGLRLLDAVHFAAAVEAQCAIFVTNDARLKRLANLEVLQIGNL